MTDSQGKSVHVFRTDLRVRQTLMFLQSDLDRRLALAEIAARVLLSVPRLIHVFRDEVGVSPGQYRKSLRLREAARLLETTALSVKEIAAKVGLSPGRLAKEFRHKYEVRPVEYRRRVWAKSLEQNGDEIVKVA